MKKVFLVLVAFIFYFSTTSFLYAQELESPLPRLETSLETFYKAKILNIKEQGQKEDVGGILNDYQLLELKILNGDQKGKQILLQYGGDFDLQKNQFLRVNQLVILNKIQEGNDFHYSVYDTYRLNGLIFSFIVFIFLVITISRWQGLASFIGMIFSLFVIIWWAIPAIINGRNPFLVSFLSTLVIALVSLYLAHGMKKRTTVALFGILITVAFCIIISLLITHYLFLTGGGSEEAFSLQLFNLPDLDLKGLFLGGIIIGALGVLDDVTMTQSAAIEELKKANPDFDFKELYIRGMSIGREHIASLVNTLVLAYAGASFPLLIFFHFTDSQPVWTLFNNESMAEEIVRTLVGSTALLLAVPITTFLAAYTFGKTERKQETKPSKQL